MSKALTFAAVAEGATGLALLIAPSLVGQLLLGDDLSGAAEPVARVAGIALIALAVACRPGPPLAGMLVFKGLTLHAIIGRRVFDTWIKMLDLFRAGLDVEDLVTNEFEGLEKFHEVMELLGDRRAMKVVFWPNGKR